jgi:hypothetical protein
MVRRRLEGLVLERHGPRGGRALDATARLDVALEGASAVDWPGLSRRRPHGRLRAERLADVDDVPIVVDGPVAHRAVDVRERTSDRRSPGPAGPERCSSSRADAQPARVQALHEPGSRGSSHGMCSDTALTAPPHNRLSTAMSSSFPRGGWACPAAETAKRVPPTPTPAGHLHLERLDLAQHGLHVEAAFGELLTRPASLSRAPSPTQGLVHATSGRPSSRRRRRGSRHPSS